MVMLFLSRKAATLVGPVSREQDEKLSKDILYGELADGVKTMGGSHLLYRFKHHFKTCGIETVSWEVC